MLEATALAETLQRECIRRREEVLGWCPRAVGVRGQDEEEEVAEQTRKGAGEVERLPEAKGRRHPVRERCGVSPASAGPAVWRCRVTRCEQSRQRSGWRSHTVGGLLHLFQGGDITAHLCDTQTILQIGPAERGAAIQAVRDQLLDESNTPLCFSAAPLHLENSKVCPHPSHSPNSVLAGFLFPTLLHVTCGHLTRTAAGLGHSKPALRVSAAPGGATETRAWRQGPECKPSSSISELCGLSQLLWQNGGDDGTYLVGLL